MGILGVIWCTRRNQKQNYGMARINNIFDLNLVLNKIIPRGWVRVHLVYPQTHTSAQEAMVSTVLNAKASILMASDLIRTSPTPNQPPQVYPQTHTSAQEAMVSTVLNAKASILMASDLTRTSPTPNQPPQATAAGRRLAAKCVLSGKWQSGSLGDPACQEKCPFSAEEWCLWGRGQF